jgi:regulatory protein
MPSAYLDALRMLARRELSVKEVRDRLIEREHTPDEIEKAIEHLLETKALDDGRVARAYARTALKIKGRGRLRVQRELQQMGIERGVIAEALGEAFGDVDERSLIANAIKKKLRRTQTIVTPADYARVYQFLMRQGFSPGAITTALRSYRRGAAFED